jgi:hypothetical protein
MSQFFGDNWMWLLALGVGALGLWLGLSVLRPGQSKGRSLLRVFLWGPFAGPAENYLAKRGGLTKREKLGWAVVGLLMLGVLVSVFLAQK